MNTLLVLCALIGAEPAAAQQELLQTFRAEFVQITPGQGEFPGEFQMGRDDGPQHEAPAHVVKLSEPFGMARYEVPQNLWEAVMGNNPSRWKGPRNSVELVNFNEANEFCDKVTEQLRAAKLIGPKDVVRLPTEAEWEYCARAGSRTLYSFGDDSQHLGQYGWFTGNAKGNDPPVGAKKPNAWQLYDMHGYLWEWTLDDWHAGYGDAPTNGVAWTAKAKSSIAAGVLRSGSWKDDVDQLTSSTRRKAERELRDDAVGLRCVLVEE